MSIELRQVLPRLVEWFPAEVHVRRELKGSGVWWYVPWQVIRQRLNEVCPGEWSVAYDQPQFLDKWCYIHCTVAICGVAQQGLGSAEVELISNRGNDMARGNPIERATADAFKNACENFGIAAYLDDQSDPKKKEAFARYMHQRGSGKAISELQKQKIAEHRAAPKPVEQTGDVVPDVLISEAQAKRLWAMARAAGYTQEGVRALIGAYSFESSKDVTKAAYDAICERAGSSEWAQKYNGELAAFAQN